MFQQINFLKQNRVNKVSVSRGINFFNEQLMPNVNSDSAMDTIRMHALDKEDYFGSRLAFDLKHESPQLLSIQSAH